MADKNLPVPPPPSSKPPRDIPSRDRLFSFGSLGSPPMFNPLHSPQKPKLNHSTPAAGK